MVVLVTAHGEPHQLPLASGLAQRVAPVRAPRVLPLEVGGIPAHAHGVAAPGALPQCVVGGAEAGNRPHLDAAGDGGPLGMEGLQGQAQYRRRRGPQRLAEVAVRHRSGVQDLLEEGHRSHVAIRELLEEPVGRRREPQAQGHLHVVAPGREEPRPEPAAAGLGAQEDVHPPGGADLPPAPPQPHRHRGVLAEHLLALAGHPDLGAVRAGGRVVDVLPAPPPAAGLGEVGAEDALVEPEDLVRVAGSAALHRQKAHHPPVKTGKLTRECAACYGRRPWRYRPARA